MCTGSIWRILGRKEMYEDCREDGMKPQQPHGPGRMMLPMQHITSLNIFCSSNISCTINISTNCSCYCLPLNVSNFVTIMNGARFGMKSVAHNHLQQSPRILSLSTRTHAEYYTYVCTLHFPWKFQNAFHK
jgi:hypothetical protein